ncbi:PGF-pre-PGF domain-containing protein [Candidatus Pacearchaeota archaeon]|nr:PGF-pre-PGF domain-containing protein [Candidatus Pacearchaeota archaeon]
MIFKKRGLLVFVLAILLLGVLVFAASSAPTSVRFTGNASMNFDEGSFFINWTNASMDTSYRIYIWANGVIFNASAVNVSATGFRFVNTTQANYTFIVEALNGTAVVGSANSSNVSIFVDSSALTGIDLAGYTNNTWKTSNANTFTLNATLADAISGGSACVVELYFSNGTSAGTNQTVLATSNGTLCNSTSLSLTGLADGNYSITVHANDSANNWGVNSTFFNIGLDSTAPSPTAACPSGSVYTNADFPCTCSATDTTSGVASATGSSNSPQGILSPITTGTFTYTCLGTDTAGNTGSSTSTFTVISQGGSGSPSGDSGSQTSSSKSDSFIWNKITPGKVEIIKTFDEGTGIKEIQINVKNKAQNVKITVTKYDGKPAEVTLEKSGEVYQYIHINTENLNDNLLYANVKFKVNKTWVSGNGLEKESISVFKFDETSKEWKELETTFDGEDAQNYYYNVPLSSFSYFAISEKALASENAQDSGNEENGTLPQNEGGEVSSSTSWWIWAIIIVAVVVIVGVLVSKGKKTKKFLKFGY